MYDGRPDRAYTPVASNTNTTIVRDTLPIRLDNVATNFGREVRACCKNRLTEGA
jgi:hypothetical protein